PFRNRLRKVPKANGPIVVGTREGPLPIGRYRQGGGALRVSQKAVGLFHGPQVPDADAVVLLEAAGRSHIVAPTGANGVIARHRQARNVALMARKSADLPLG